MVEQQHDRYSRRCASAAAPCGDFNATLHAYARRAQFSPNRERVLIVHNENRAGFGNQIRPRLVALWLGLALDRRVYVKSCQRDGTTKRWRMPRCGTPHFQADDFLEVLGVGALAWPEAADDAEMFFVDNWQNNVSVLFDPAIHARRVVGVRFRNHGAVNHGADALLRLLPSLGARVCANAGRAACALAQRRCFDDCAGFAAMQPTAALRRLVAPALRQMGRAPKRVGLHVRTIASDDAYCFPDETAAEAAAIDAAFGRDECIRRSDEHWRFRLKPFPAFDAAGCRIQHLADSFPLSGWLGCGAALFGPEAAVFLATDATALERFATSPAAASVVGGARVLTAVASDGAEPTAGAAAAIGHSHLAKGSWARQRAVGARTVADWLLLTQCDVVLVPVATTFSGQESLCAAWGGDCPLRFGRPDADEQCLVDRCFARECRKCKLHYGQVFAERTYKITKALVVEGRLGPEASSSPPPPPPPHPLVGGIRTAFFTTPLWRRAAAPAATPPPSAAPIAAGPSPMRVASIVVVEVAIAAVVLLALARRCAAFPQARPGYARVRSA